MILPTDEQCLAIVRELHGDPALKGFELSFVNSNQSRQVFSDRQKHVCYDLAEKYELQSFQPR